MNIEASVARLSDEELIGEVKRLTRHEAEATAALIASLAELDARRLYLEEGCPSLFAYCTQVLHLSEHAAYHRIEAARASRRFPLVLERLRSRELTLTAVGLLATHLTVANHRDLLDAARHQGKRAVEEIVARLRPLPDVAASVRKAPEQRVVAGQAHGHLLAPVVAPTSVASVGAGGVAATPPPDRLDDLASALPPGASAALSPRSAAADRTAVASSVRPLAPARYHVHLTVSTETRDKLKRAQDLLRHVLPDGDLAEVFDRALTVLLEQLERRNMAATAGNGRQALKAADRATNAGGRHVPAAVRRAVWARDGGRCTFVGHAGRCEERAFLEIHHRVPFASGGSATVQNLTLLCRAHNGHEAERFFGRTEARG